MQDVKPFFEGGFILFASGGVCYMDYGTKRAVVSGKVFRAFYFLMKHADTLCTTEELMAYVWGGPKWKGQDTNPDEQDVYVLMSEVRARARRLSPEGAKQLITLRYVGYVFATKHAILTPREYLLKRLSPLPEIEYAA